MKTYIYAIDHVKRFTEIYEANEDNLKKFYHYSKIELSDQDFEKIINNGNYGLVNGEIVLIDNTEEEILNNKIAEKQSLDYKINSLKINLNNTDYQVIKCLEAKELEEEMPYNLQELLAQRKAWREEINALEFKISMLG
jgi:hypothetical protein